jgi:hypothetical protein
MRWPFVLRSRYDDLSARRECLGYKLDDAELSRDEAISVAARIAYRYDRLGRIVAAHIVAAERAAAGKTAVDAESMASDLREAIAAAGIDLSIEFARIEGREGVPS